MRFEALTIAHPDGGRMTQPLTTDIALGEHVRVESSLELGRKLLQVISGLWPWGGGRVVLPAGTLSF